MFFFAFFPSNYSSSWLWLEIFSSTHNNLLSALTKCKQVATKQIMPFKYLKTLHKIFPLSRCCEIKWKSLFEYFKLSFIPFIVSVSHLSFSCLTLHLTYNPCLWFVVVSQLRWWWRNSFKSYHRLPGEDLNVDVSSPFGIRCLLSYHGNKYFMIMTMRLSLRRVKAETFNLLTLLPLVLTPLSRANFQVVEHLFV